MGFKLKILGLIVLWGGLLFGQNQGFTFRNYGIKEGLSQSTIVNIFQDKKGFLWFSTSDGLNQFDGYKFTIYKNNYLNTNSISDNWVKYIFEDSDDELWLFTEDRVINKLNLRTQEITRFVPGKSDLPQFNEVHCVFEDDRKNVWISTDSCLCQYNKKLKKIIQYQQNPTSPTHIKANKVLQIIEDAKGFLWFATLNGLYRYRSSSDSFDLFLSQPCVKGSLMSNTIIRVQEDKANNLWIFTPKGLNLFQPESNRFITFPIPHEIKDEASFFNSCIIDRNGFFWIGSNKGLYRFDPKTGRYYTYKSNRKKKGALSDNAISRIIEDRSGNIWVGTLSGLNKYDPSTDCFENFYAEVKEGNTITDILEDKNGDILTIGKLEDSKGAYLSYLNKETGKLQIQFNDKCNPNSIASTFVYQPFVDASGNIWLKTFGNGAVQYVPRNKKFEYYSYWPGNPYFLNGNSVWGFAEDEDGNIWIPLHDKGLDKFNPQTKRFTHFVPEANRAVKKHPFSLFTIIKGANGDLWMSTTGGGILRYNTRTGKFKQFLHDDRNPNSISSNFMRQIAVDSLGKLWVGYSTTGVDYFDPVTEKAIHFKNDRNDKNSLAYNNTWSLLLDKKGEVWISCDGFIDRYNPATRQFTHYKSKSTDFTGIIADKAICVFEDSKNNIWFGTSGGGLSLFDRKTSKFRHWTETDGLPNNVVYGILEDDQGCLWLSTNRGLSKFNIKNNTFKNYDENDGLQSNEFNMGSCFKSSGGKLYFGGINGFNAFYPKDLKPDTLKPETVITGFQIFDKEIQVVSPDKQKLINKNNPTLIVRDDKAIYLPQNITYTDEITLTYREKVFTLEYAGLYFESPEKPTYRYKMENFDPDWNYAGNRRFATYTNLREGTYIFKVEAANADGVWNMTPTLIKVRILPPFWRTWWFLICEGLFMAGMIMLIVRLRVIRLKHAKTSLEKKVNERTKEIKEKNKELELRNLQILKQKEEIAVQTQQLKTELTVQNQTSEQALLRSQINPHFLFNTLNNIYSLVYQRSDNAPEAVMKLSEIMRYMLYEATSEKVLLKNEINYLKSFIELQLLRIKNKEFVSFNMTGNFENRTISPMLFIAFVENAFKHGEKRGVNPGITINLDILDNKINFEVINYCKKNDTSHKDITGGIGLINIKRRLELLLPNKFQLDIMNNDEIYHVKLQIKE